MASKMTFHKSDRALKVQGNRAEKQVSMVLRSMGCAYRVFDNVMLKTGGGTTQIDHVVISNFGIFVIETKSHKGRIFGDCYSRKWTQVLFTKQGQKNYTFYSPYLQNSGHLKNLYKLFGLSYTNFLGVIVFTDEMVDLTRVRCPCAVRLDSLASVITSYRKVLFTDSEVSYLCDILRRNNIQSAYFDRKHKVYVKSLAR